MSGYVFISYATAQRAVADRVVARLEHAGIECWYAPRNVGAGDDFGGAIFRALSHAEAMVLLFCEDSTKSEYVSRELHLAVERHIPIIPLRLWSGKPADGVGFLLAGKHWIDYLTGAEKALNSLADQLIRIHVGARPSPRANVPSPQPDPAQESRRVPTARPTSVATGRTRTPPTPPARPQKRAAIAPPPSRDQRDNSIGIKIVAIVILGAGAALVGTGVLLMIFR